MVKENKFKKNIKKSDANKTHVKIYAGNSLMSSSFQSISSYNVCHKPNYTLQWYIDFKLGSRCGPKWFACRNFEMV